MQIKIFKDLKKFTLTSSISREELELVAKYRPAALTKNEDGNPVFTVSYVEGKPCIAPFGVTFGSTSVDGGFVMITGDLPDNLEGQTYGEYVADKVGTALENLYEFEAAIPTVAAEIKAKRSELIGGIVEA